MSYCGPPDGISDYHFANALRYRLFDARAEAETVASASARSLLLWGGANADGAPFLNPVFVVDSPPALPDSAGAYTLTGRTARGTELFSLRFAMPRTADGAGGSGFAFALPAEPGWAGDLAAITLDGPGGTFALSDDSDVPTAILRDPRTGRVRGILREVPPPARAAMERGGAVRGAGARDAVQPRDAGRGGVAAMTGPRRTGAKALQPIEMDSHTGTRTTFPPHKEAAG